MLLSDKRHNEPDSIHHFGLLLLLVILIIILIPSGPYERTGRIRSKIRIMSRRGAGSATAPFLSKGCLSLV
jgi:hypothetical protein